MLWAWTSFKAFTLKLLISNLSPQMSQVTKLVLDPGETSEHRIESFLAIMSEDLSGDNRLVLEKNVCVQEKSEGGHKRC